MSLERLRNRYDAYAEAFEREIYRFRAGRKSRLELAEVDSRFEDLTSGDAADELERAVGEAPREEERADRRKLLLAVQRTGVRRALRELTRELHEREATLRVAVDGDERTLYAWQAHIGSEADGDRRARIQEALEQGWAEHNRLREEIRSARADALAQRGHPTERRWAEAGHPGVDYDVWRAHTERLLGETEAAYRDSMARALAAIGVDAGSAHPGDAARVFRMAEFDRLFPPSRAEQAFDFTTEAMGVRLRDVRGLVVDREARPGKHPRACVIAPRVPGEVYLLTYPHGGEPDYESFFHEAGHALHAGLSGAGLPVERRRLCDPGLSETWAFLFHYRLADPVWVDQGPASERAELLLPVVRLRKLYLVRRYAAKVRFELELCSAPPDRSPAPFAGRYAEELSTATGLRFGPSGYLADTDPDLYCVDYLRAWCFESILADWLRERFGRAFWRERRAGDLLKELWNTGGTYTADGLAEQLGLGPIGPEALLEDFRRAFGAGPSRVERGLA